MANKFLCIGGPLDGQKKGYEDDVPDSYIMYNRSHFNRKIASAVWIHESLLSLEPIVKVKKKRQPRLKPLELNVLDVERVV